MNEHIVELIVVLELCLKEMELLQEGDECDHSMGICWCSYWELRDRARHAIKTMKSALGQQQITIFDEEVE